MFTATVPLAIDVLPFGEPLEVVQETQRFSARASRIQLFAEGSLPRRGEGLYLLFARLHQMMRSLIQLDSLDSSICGPRVTPRSSLTEIGSVNRLSH